MIRAGGGVEAESDEQAEADHQRQREHAAAEVGERAACEHRRAGHRQAAEAVDDPAAQIVGQPDRGRHAADHHRLDENRGNDVVDVAGPGNVDRAAKHVAEQHEQQGRLDRGDHEQPRVAHDAQKVAPRDAAGIAEAGGRRPSHICSRRLAHRPLARAARRRAVGPISGRAVAASMGSSRR